MRILFDKNVPVGLRAFLAGHEVSTLVEMNYPEQLENGKLLKAAEESGFHVMVTSDQNIRHQQNLTGRRLAFRLGTKSRSRKSMIESPSIAARWLTPIFRRHLGVALRGMTLPDSDSPE